MTEQEIIDKFGFDPGSIGRRYRSHWIIEEMDDEVERGGASIGDLCVRARDGAGNPMCAESCRHSNFAGTSEDGFDCTYRYYYYKPKGVSEIDQLRAEVERLRNIKRIYEFLKNDLACDFDEEFLCRKLGIDYAAIQAAWERGE